MTDWTEQMAGFQKKWLEQQQQLLGNWQQALQGTIGVQPADSWQQAIDVIEQQVNSVLDMQKQSLKTLAENSQNFEDMPEAMTEWMQQIDSGIDRWNDVQQRLWQTWFNMLRAASPVKEQPGDVMARNWQEFVNKTMEIQQQCLSGWMNMQAEAKKPAGKKST